ncbi:GTP-binding protein [Microbacterium sp. No. 7]|uniref:GTP-binding protein n=1 Tax=Microbacterium sp. No. 7 TaxID=1714373 RepID=UPI0006D1AB15|nr:GTP-binding protein [Microbacterium sp. No. 7]ALJ19805.1 hypothetical protein AOA12_07750 [Microbacterium sp. No. 7]
MTQIDVIAVVGSCGAERQRHAERLAETTGRMLVSARRLALSPDPVDEAAALASWADTPAGAVLEFPHETLTTEVIGALAAPDATTRLLDVVCVADASHLLDDLRRETYARRLAPPWWHPSPPQYVAHAMLTVTQLEYASVIVLVNWEPLPTATLSTVMSLISHLAPHARLRLQRDGAGQWPAGPPYTPAQTRAGWLGILSDDFDPHMTDPRVRAMRYENVRPLHPGRLERLLDDRIEPGELGTVIRSAGFCRFATRPHLVGRWEHVGSMISFEPLGGDDLVADDDELLAVGQDLAFIGIDLDRDALAAALDATALTDEELAAGPAAWAGFADPFPTWVPATRPAE